MDRRRRGHYLQRGTPRAKRYVMLTPPPTPRSATTRARRVSASTVSRGSDTSVAVSNKRVVLRRLHVAERDHVHAHADIVAAPVRRAHVHQANRSATRAGHARYAGNSARHTSTDRALGNLGRHIERRVHHFVGADRVRAFAAGTCAGGCIRRSRRATKRAAPAAASRVGQRRRRRLAPRASPAGSAGRDCPRRRRHSDARNVAPRAYRRDSFRNARAVWRTFSNAARSASTRDVHGGGPAQRACVTLHQHRPKRDRHRHRCGDSVGDAHIHQIAAHAVEEELRERERRRIVKVGRVDDDAWPGAQTRSCARRHRHLRPANRPDCAGPFMPPRIAPAQDAGERPRRRRQSRARYASSNVSSPASPCCA